VKKLGRPAIFKQSTADLLCERISDGASVRSVCKLQSMPCLATVLKWARENPEFAGQYARAMESRADAKFDELDDVSEQAAKARSSVKVAGLRLKADNMKWMLARMAPKKYGEKLEHSGGIAMSLTQMVEGSLKEDT
jgi:hypothetical protein